MLTTVQNVVDRTKKNNIFWAAHVSTHLHYKRKKKKIIYHSMKNYLSLLLLFFKFSYFCKYLVFIVWALIKILGNDLLSWNIEGKKEKKNQSSKNFKPLIELFTKNLERETCLITLALDRQNLSWTSLNVACN